MRKPTSRKLVRKQVYIEPEQDSRLKQLAKDRGLTEAQIIRQALAQRLIVILPLQPDRSAWERERTFICEREKQVTTVPSRPWTREELYEERLNRCGP